MKAIEALKRVASLLDVRALPMIADGLVITIAGFLPWSTSVTAIMIVLWLIALVPTAAAGAGAMTEIVEDGVAPGAGELGSLGKVPGAVEYTGACDQLAPCLLRGAPGEASSNPSAEVMPIQNVNLTMHAPQATGFL
jgi:hypothetical protein